MPSADERHKMSEHTLQLGVRADSAAEADRLVADLQTFLKRRTEHVRLNRERTGSDTQDVGTILVAMFSAPAIVELAERKCAQYPDGGTVTAYVDPRDPKRSMLEAPISGAALVFLFVSILCAVFGFALMCAADWLARESAYLRKMARSLDTAGGRLSAVLGRCQSEQASAP
jgi:hypothetical protein